MERLKHMLKDQRGFSLVELILYMVISAIVVGVTAQTITAQIETYAMLSTRQSMLSDSRYALNQIANDLRYVDREDLIDFDSDSLEFVDTVGTNVTLSLNNHRLMRNNEILLNPVQSFALEYLDLNGHATANANAICRIRITLITQAQGDEGEITLATMVTPRNLLYDNYQ